FSKQIQKQIDELCRTCGLKLIGSEPSVRELILAKDALPVVPPSLFVELLPKLSDRKNRETLRCICKRLSEYRQIRQQTDKCFSRKPDLRAPELRTLRSFCLEVIAMDIDWRTLDEVKTYSQEIEEYVIDLSRISSWFQSICSILNCPLPFTVHTLWLVLKIVESFEEI